MFIPRKAVALPLRGRTIDDYWIGSDEVTAHGNLQRILHRDVLFACLSPSESCDLCACVPDLQHEGLCGCSSVRCSTDEWPGRKELILAQRDASTFVTFAGFSIIKQQPHTCSQYLCSPRTLLLSIVFGICNPQQPPRQECLQVRLRSG